jgi:hypothetical protein
MSKTITVHIPAKRLNPKFVRPARTETVMQDDAGRWTKVADELERKAMGQDAIPLTELDVIEILSRAPNWADIRREHFPMHGFHA